LKRDEQKALNDKLAALEKKIIVGGENLLEKAEEQAKLLEASEQQLEKQKQKQKEIKERLDKKEVRKMTAKLFIFLIKEK